MKEIRLQPCPFCGGEAQLRKVRNGYSTNPVTIRDAWIVECQKGCCETQAFTDEIYHNNDGRVIAAHNGAIEAANQWNQRYDNYSSV